MNSRLGLALIALVSCGCSSSDRKVPASPTSNRDPIIRSISSPASIELGDDATFRVDAEDPDGDKLSAVFFAQTGSFSSQGSALVGLYHSVRAGSDQIVVSVQDDEGGVASKRVALEVLPDSDPPQNPAGPGSLRPSFVPEPLNGTIYLPQPGIVNVGPCHGVAGARFRIDWGEGNAPVVGSCASAALRLGHEYAQEGRFSLAVEAREGNKGKVASNTRIDVEVGTQ